MGKLILCSGKRTDRPYVLPDSGERIYSIEELCYYIYNNVYSIEEAMFTASLIDWIGKELGLSERAEKLYTLKKQGADLKTLITVVLCSADYYTESEIKKLLSVIDEIRAMPSARRRYLKANAYLKRKLYSEATAEYESLLVSEDAINLDPKSYGDVLHNLAIAKLHLYGPGKALELFRQAYERNQRPESLKQYLYTLWQCQDREMFYEKLKEYNADDETAAKIALKLEQLSDEARLSGDMKELQILRALYKTGKTEEFEIKCKEMLDRWIKEIRSI